MQVNLVDYCENDATSIYMDLESEWLPPEKKISQNVSIKSIESL